MNRTVRPIWGYCGAVLLAASGVGVLAAAPFLSPSTVDHPAGVVFSPRFGLGRAIEAIGRADPSARILDVSWRGTVVFVRYDDRRFPALIARLGALHSFDALVAGCHGPLRLASPASGGLARRASPGP